jgi:CubicO group peptidase (beta-lactamase class C family)
LLTSDDPELRPVIDSVHDIIEKELTSRHIPGASIALVDDQQIFWSKGYGYSNVDERLPATEKTIYGIGSITKLFTGAMLMQLRDSGQLYLDEPIEKYLPSFKIRSKFGDNDPITFRQVASHTSGLPIESPANNWSTLHFSGIDEVIASLRELELVYAPFSRTKYSNLGYGILGHVLGIVAQRSYKGYVEENILQPLNMSHTGFDPDSPNISEDLATGYTLNSKGELIAAPLVDFAALVSAGGLYSNVIDLSRFVSLHFRDDDDVTGRSLPQPKILKSSSLREMHTPVRIDSAWLGGVGIGWHTAKFNDETVIMHIGLSLGFSTDVTLVPDIKLGMVVLTNGMTDAHEISMSCLEKIIPIVRKKIHDQKLPPTPSASANWQEFVGRYATQFFGYDVKITNEKLAMIDLMNPKGEILLTQEGPDEFRMIGGDWDGEIAKFDRGNGNKIVGIKVVGAYLECVDV